MGGPTEYSHVRYFFRGKDGVAVAPLLGWYGGRYQGVGVGVFADVVVA